MKVGDTFPVIVAGIDTGAKAVVKHFADGKVTVEFPATQFVAQTRTEITTEVPREAPATERIVDEVVRTPATPVSDTAAVGGQAGPVEVEKPETPAEVSAAAAPVAEEKPAETPSD